LEKKLDYKTPGRGKAGKKSLGVLIEEGAISEAGQLVEKKEDIDGVIELRRNLRIKRA